MQTVLKHSPTWNLGDGRIIGRQKDLEDHYALVYWGKDPSTFPTWLCPKPRRFRGGYKSVKNRERLIWHLQQNQQATETFVELKVEWERGS
jgi:hypothetical protein